MSDHTAFVASPQLSVATKQSPVDPNPLINSHGGIANIIIKELSGLSGLFDFELTLEQLAKLHKLCRCLAFCKSSNISVTFGVVHDHVSFDKCDECNAKCVQAQAAQAKAAAKASKKAEADKCKIEIVQKIFTINHTTFTFAMNKNVNVQQLMNAAFNVTVGAPTCCEKTCKNFQIKFTGPEKDFDRVIEEDIKMSRRSNTKVSTEIVEILRTENPTNKNWWINKVSAVTTHGGNTYCRNAEVGTPKLLGNLSPAHFDDMFKLCFDASSVHCKETIKAQYQTDTHGTKAPGGGGIYIGLTLTLNDKYYSIYLVGKDIGCGISTFPLFVNVNGKYKRMTDRQLQMLKKDLIIVAQIFNRRGVKVENGSSVFTKEQFEEYAGYLKRGYQHCGKDFNAAMLSAYDILKLAEEIKTDCQSDNEKIATALQYVLPRLLSIGSTGNHYIEVNGGLFMTIHSGSRSLGSVLDEWMSKYFGKINGCKTVAIEKEHAEMAGRIYGLLNDIASANRAAVFYMIVTKLNKILEKDGTQRYGFAESVDDVLEAFQQMPFIQEYNERTGCGLAQTVDKMRVGNIHNGITVYNEIGTNRFAVVITKGSVVTDSIAIVADKASEGCIIVYRTFENKKYKAVTFEEFSTVEDPVFCSLEVFGLTSLPHGSGRNRGGNESARQTKSSLIDDIIESNMYISCGIGTSFDNPISASSLDGEGAYRKSGIDEYSGDLVVEKYPMDVNFKENVCQETTLITQFRDMAWYMWENVFEKAVPVKGSPLYEKFTHFLICTDLILIKQLMTMKEPKIPLPFVQLLCNLKYTAEYEQTNGCFANVGLRNEKAQYYDKRDPISSDGQ